MIAIIGAMKSEVEQLTARMEAVQMVSQTGMDFYVGTLAGKEVVVVQCGVGKVNAALNIRNRRDIQIFMEQLNTGKSTPLLNLTSGYHFHKVMADREEILDEIEEALREKGMLTEVFSYEKELAEV